MACEQHKHALTDVAAGASMPAGVDAHLAACAACRAELAALRQALALADAELAGLLAAEPTPELTARIRKAVADSVSGAPGWRRSFRFAAGMAALFAAVVFVAQRGSQPTPAAVATRAQPRPAPETPRATPTRASEVAPSSAPVESAASAGAASARGPRATSGSPTARPQRARAAPEVLVPAGEAETLLRFAASLRLRPVTPDSLLLADLSAPLSEPGGLVIQPLAIVPLDPEEDSGAE